MKKNTQAIFDKNTVEFVTVAAEFCGFLERVSEQKRSQFVDTALKLLPLLYLKASLLPECERMEDFDPETFVTESDYEQLRREVAALMGDRDDYLEVFLDDMMYSDTPIHQTVSEGLADIYQSVKDSLVICREQFAEFWGQRLVNLMRALHEVKYSRHAADDEEDDCGFEDEGVTEDELYEGLDMGEE